VRPIHSAVVLNRVRSTGGIRARDRRRVEAQTWSVPVVQRRAVQRAIKRRVVTKGGAPLGDDLIGGDW